MCSPTCRLYAKQEKYELAQSHLRKVGKASCTAVVCLHHGQCFDLPLQAVDLSKAACGARNYSLVPLLRELAQVCPVILASLSCTNSTNCSVSPV